MAEITVSDLTQSSLDGTGIFDVLMRSMRGHLDSEYRLGRLKGPEYATVYLGSLEQVMQASLTFLLQKQKTDLEAQLLAEQVALTHQQKLNAEVEFTVLQAQKCKLDAEYDLVLGNTNKAAAETALLTQKNTTEKAQVSAIGVDGDSVIGKQKALYTAQANGFQRDAEQKAATILVDTWKVRRSTDEAESANADNVLNDAAIGRAVTKLLTGVGA